MGKWSEGRGWLQRRFLVLTRYLLFCYTKNLDSEKVVLKLVEFAKNFHFIDNYIVACCRSPILLVGRSSGPS